MSRGVGFRASTRRTPRAVAENCGRASPLNDKPGGERLESGTAFCGFN